MLIRSCFLPLDFLLPEIVYSIQTRASIQAGGAVAFINVDLTAIPWEANSTITGVTTCQVLTHGSIQTGVGETLVYFQLTTRPWENVRRHFTVDINYRPDCWWGHQLSYPEWKCNAVLLSNLWSRWHNCRWTCWPRPHTPLHLDRGRTCTHSPLPHTESLGPTGIKVKSQTETENEHEGYRNIKKHYTEILNQ